MKEFFLSHRKGAIAWVWNLWITYVWGSLSLYEMGTGFCYTQLEPHQDSLQVACKDWC